MTEDDLIKEFIKDEKNPKVGPIAGWPVHTSVENSREIIKSVLAADETYAVCLRKDNVAIGSIGLTPPAQSHTKAADDEIEIGYWIGVPYWGQGLIPEAVRALQKHAFLDLGCSAMWCGYYDGNEKLLMREFLLKTAFSSYGYNFVTSAELLCTTDPVQFTMQLLRLKTRSQKYRCI